MKTSLVSSRSRSSFTKNSDELFLNYGNENFASPLRCFQTHS